MAITSTESYKKLDSIPWDIEIVLNSTVILSGDLFLRNGTEVRERRGTKLEKKERKQSRALYIPWKWQFIAIFSNIVSYYEQRDYHVRIIIIIIII